MRNKRGQFYLMATIIIIAILVGFITISNYSRKKSSTKLYDLGEELNIESQNVLDYGTYQGEDLDFLLEQFIESYVDYAGENKNLYFIFGESGGLQVVAYENLQEMTNPPTPTEVGEKIAITIDDTEYDFKLNPGENFYFVISQEIEGEKYVITG